MASAEKVIRKNAAMAIIDGRHPLKQNCHLNIAGFKHAVVPIMAASLCASTPVSLINVPRIADVIILADILKHCGFDVQHGDGELRVFPREQQSSHIVELPPDLAGQIHGSLYLIPAFTACSLAFHTVNSGGCQIGSPSSHKTRPYQHVLSTLQHFGANVTDNGPAGILGIPAQLKACTIDIREFSSDPLRLSGPLCAGATKTALITSLACKNETTTICHPYLKLDVVSLLDFCSALGCTVVRAPDTISVRPPTKFLSTEFCIPSDSIEVFSFIALSVYADIPLTLQNVSVEKTREDLREELHCLHSMGVRLEWGNSSLTIPRQTTIHPIDITVTPMGIYSDNHPFFTLMLLRAKGTSRIKEKVWLHRFSYAEELRKMGAHLTVQDDSVIIEPTPQLQGGCEVEAHDLRSAAVLCLAALKTTGKTVVHGCHHLQRGYENFFGHLRQFTNAVEVTTL